MSAARTGSTEGMLLSAVDHVVAAIETGSGAADVLRFAEDAAAQLGAKLTVLHVVGGLVSPLALRDEIADPAADREAAKRLYDTFCEGCSVDVEYATVDGRVPDAITATVADLGAGLLILGTHGRRGLDHAVQGSVTETVVRSAPCPVLSIRLPE